jgi:inosose dehydratase
MKSDGPEKTSLHLTVANAPCSWGVEFADGPRNPPWTQILDEAALAGYQGIELGPVGFMPENPEVLGEALAKRGLSLVAGVVFRPFHDPEKWSEVKDVVERTCRALAAHGARRIVFIDSISPRRASTAGRSSEAERLTGIERTDFFERLRSAARLAVEGYGLEASIHAHAAGFVEFEDELDAVLDAIDPQILSVCLDTGHSGYAGFDPVAFYRSRVGRISYLHFKDVDPIVRERVVTNRIGFYEACADGLFCNLGEGSVNFSALRDALAVSGYSGWATIEQDCDPAGSTSPLDDARANLAYLRTVRLA